MVYGAINEKGEAYYTDLGRVFDSIGNRQAEYNWFITDCVCYPNHPETAAMLSKPYCWISLKGAASVSTETLNRPVFKIISWV